MKVNLKLVIGQFVAFFAAFAVSLFLPAGTITWLAGWIYLAMFFGFFLAVNLWLYKHNPGLLQERTNLGGSDQKGWDKILFPLLLISPFAQLIVSALDAVRFHGSVAPVWIQIVGVIILMISFYLLFLTFRENSYLSPIVRIQEERERSVVSTGLYHYVRHPMYAGMLFFVMGTPFLLGSWYGLLVGLILMLVLARRAVLEERTLHDELHGYAEYMADVKHRIIPYMW